MPIDIANFANEGVESNQAPSSGASASSPSGLLFVDQAQGNDGTGDGINNKPYASIGAAVTAANAAILANTYKTVTIKIALGRYVEEVWIVNAINLDFLAGVPGTGYFSATCVEAPTDSQNAINIIGGLAYGVKLMGAVTTKGHGPNWTGIGLRIVGANNVEVENWKHTNGGQTPTATLGGAAIAYSHSEGLKLNGYQIADASQAMIWGTNGERPYLSGGQLANCFQDTFAGWWEGYRIPLASGVNATATSFSINNSAGLFAASGGFVILDSEGVWYSTMTAGAPGTLNSVQRAVVAYLVGNINNSQTTGIRIAPLSQGNAAASDVWGNIYTQPNTTIPASGSLVFDPGTGSSETITYTGLTNNGDGTYTPTGVARSGSPFSHGANAAVQDSAKASAATHSAGAQVIQASIPSGLNGLLGGGVQRQGHKSTAGVNTFATSGVYTEDWWGGGNILDGDDVSESVNNVVRFRATSTHNEHRDCNIAPETVVIDDGTGNVYRSPQGGALILSALSYKCSVEQNLTDPNIFATQVTNNGTANELNHGRTGIRADSALPSGSSQDVLVLASFNPMDLWAARQKDATFAVSGTTERDLYDRDFGVVHTGTYNAKNSYTRSSVAQILPGPLNGPSPAFQVSPVPSGNVFGIAEFFQDGGFPTDQFTLIGQAWTDPAQAIDFHDVPSGRNILFMDSGSGNNNQTLTVGMTSANRLKAALQNNESNTGEGGTNKTLQALITLTAPLTLTNVTLATSGNHLQNLSSAPTVGVQAVGRGIPPGTFVNSTSGAGPFNAVLSNAPDMALTGGTVNFSDCPLNVAQQATISASGTTTNASNSVAYTGSTPPVAGMRARGPGIPEGTYVNATPTGSTGAYTALLSANAGTGFGTGTVTFDDISRTQGGFYPPTPVLNWCVIWDGTNLTLLIGDNRKSNSVAITTGTANGTVAGNGQSVTNWPNAITPVAGMSVTGGGALPGTRIIGAVTGSTANWNFTVSRAIPNTGTQSLTVFNELMPRPWASQVGLAGVSGLYVGASGVSASNSDDIFIGTAPVCLRYARNYSSLPTTLPGSGNTTPTPQTPYAPAISIDLATTGAAFPSRLGGVNRAQTAGHGLTEAAETAPGIRNQQIQDLVGMGMLVGREAEFHRRILATVNCWAGTGNATGTAQITNLNLTTTAGAGSGVTYTTPQAGDTIGIAGLAGPVTITNVVSGSGTGPYVVNTSKTISSATGFTLGGGNVALASTADFDAKYDRWHIGYGGTPNSAAPIPYQIHQTLGFTTAAFNGNVAGDSTTVPNVTGLASDAVFALNAIYFSLVVSRIQARYPGHLYSISLWNEFESDGGAWTLALVKAFWSATSGQIAADQGGNGLRLGGTDGGYMVGGGTAQADQQGIITQAATDSRSLPTLYTHNYTGDRASHLEEALALSIQAANSGFYPKIALTEYDISLGQPSFNQWYPLQWDQNAGTFGVMQAAWLHDALYWLNAHGFDLAAYFQLSQPVWGGTTFDPFNPVEGVISAQANPRLLPAGVALSTFWKHRGKQLTNVTSNWPGFRALGSSNGQVKTITYSYFRPSQRRVVLPVQFDHKGTLPTQGVSASGTVSGTTTVTGWGGSTPPLVGMPVSGGGLAAGATVQGPISGGPWNWNFTLSSAATNGAQALTISAPAPFTWEEYRYDYRDIGEPRMNLVRRGDQTNPPDGTNLTGCGLGMFRCYA